MNILLVFATELEAKGFEIPNSNHNIKKLITGVSSYNSIYKLTKACLSQKIDWVIHAGIAGTFDESFKIGSVVQVIDDVFADVGVWEQGDFKSLVDLNLSKTEDLNIEIEEFSTELPKAKGITVNTITACNDVKQKWKQKYNAQIESMEGAAVHFVCKQEKIPCVHIRAISNYVAERDKLQWNIKLALENLHKELALILRGLLIIWK